MHSHISPSTAVTDLSYDLWEYIATFLSQKELANLLSVNHSLYDIAMNARYRKISIASLSVMETQRNLSMLINPNVAARVRSLHLEPGLLCFRLLEDNIARFTHIDPSLTDQVDKDSTMERISTVMGNLKYITTLRVDINGPHYEYYQKLNPPFLRIGWDSFRGSVQTLELRVPMESMSTILPDLADGTVKNLEALLLEIKRASPLDTRTEEIMLATLTPFIYAHRHSLQSITVESAEKTNFSPLWHAVHFPLLNHFRLVQPYFDESTADYTGVHQLLRDHRYQLKSLEISIGFPIPDDGSLEFAIFTQQCFREPLPNLQSLILQYNFADQLVPSRVRDSVIKFIHQFAPTLTSLTFTACLLQFSMTQLVEGFCGTSNLTELNVSTFSFDASLIKLFSDNLLGLDKLTIGFIAFAPQFSDEIQRLDLSRWQLRSLTVYIGTTLGRRPKKEALNRNYVALVEALPNIAMFCGENRSEFLASVQKRRRSL